MELRGRVIPEPWPIPPVRTPREMEASLLDSDVQELLGAEELAGDELTRQSAPSMGCSDRISECREVVRTRLLRDSTCSGWERRHFCGACKSGLLGTLESDVDVPLIGGPSGTAHPSDSCAVVFFTQTASDFESQLEVVSEVPGGSIGFSSDGRPPHFPSLVRIAAWDERCSVVEESCALSAPGSAEEEQAGSSLAVAKARSAKKAAKRSAPSGIAAPPPKRQCQAEVQATMLAHVEECAGRLAALEASGVTPISTPCSSSPAMLGIPAQRCTRLALCLEPVQASVAYVSLSSQLAQSHQEAMCGIAKNLLPAVRTVMDQEQVDMVAGDFNVAA